MSFALFLPAASAHLPTTQSAGTQIYWANEGDDTLGRANLDGTSAEPHFVTLSSSPHGLTIDGAYLYWGAAQGSVGRASLDGSVIDESFIPTAGPPTGVALDGARIYWTQVVSGSGKVARANLDGSAPNQSLVDTGPSPCGVTASADDLYWANGGDPGSIGTVHIGSTAADQNLVGAAGGPCGVAIAGDYVYWANRTGGSIGRARLDGSDADNRFITTASPPCGVAIRAGHVYWTEAGGTIARAELDGTEKDEALITAGQSPCGIAISPSFDVAPGPGDFPPTTVGRRSAIAAFVVTNTSSSVLDVAAVNFAGKDPEDFEKTGDSCTVGVTAAVSRCIVNVRFSPRAPGQRQATLRIASNASTEPTDIPIQGLATADRTPPRFHRAAVCPPAFQVAPARRVAKGLAAAPGTSFEFALSEGARVRFTIDRDSRRVAVGGRCGRLAPSHPQKPCDCFTTVGQFARHAEAGANVEPFSGRIDGRPLAPGSYRARLVAVDRQGNASAARFLHFRVLP